MLRQLGIRRKDLFACLILLLGGCASEQPAAPSQILSGEQMLRASQGMAQLGTRWQHGKQMVERGENLVREGQGKIDTGNRMIEEGRQIMRESEEGYENFKR